MSSSAHVESSQTFWGTPTQLELVPLLNKTYPLWTVHTDISINEYVPHIPRFNSKTASASAGQVTGLSHNLLGATH